MKQKHGLINALMGLMVLLAVLFQSVHSYEHLAKEISGKSCFHKYSKNTSLNHSHHWEKCTVCDFTFANVAAIEMPFAFSVKRAAYIKSISFTAAENIPFFSGSFFSLRGPPFGSTFAFLKC